MANKRDPAKGLDVGPPPPTAPPPTPPALYALPPKPVPKKVEENFWVVRATGPTVLEFVSDVSCLHMLCYCLAAMCCIK